MSVAASVGKTVGLACCTSGDPALLALLFPALFCTDGDAAGLSACLIFTFEHSVQMYKPFRVHHGKHCSSRPLPWCLCFVAERPYLSAQGDWPPGFCQVTAEISLLENFLHPQVNIQLRIPGRLTGSISPSPHFPLQLIVSTTTTTTRRRKGANGSVLFTTFVSCGR